MCLVLLAFGIDGDYIAFFFPFVTIVPVALSDRGKSGFNKVHTASEDMSIISCPAYFMC